MSDKSLECAEPSSVSAQNDGPGTKTSLWQIEVSAAENQPDRLGASVLADAVDLGLPTGTKISGARGFLVQGILAKEDAFRISQQLLTDSIVETAIVARPGSADFRSDSETPSEMFYVLPLPGVTDPQAESALTAIRDMGFAVEAVGTFCKYETSPLDDSSRKILCEKLIANESIERVVCGQLEMDALQLGQPYDFDLKHVGILVASDESLQDISREYQLSLSLIEMQTIQAHFKSLEREPTDAELETVAQTWSEHCSHKTLAGRVSYTDENGRRDFDNMLKETIFSATVSIREELGEDDWCVSVFKDNAGIVRFDEEFNVAFKVETHNRPSALEPYGGANTGIGGVIRDTLGTGLGAKPICSTDVFCFASPDKTVDELPPGVMHPRRIMKGVVSGVRDYGNRMGIPTVNGAVYFDDRYVGNPLVFCGNIGLLPHEKSFKEVQPNDLIVSIGGRTGRDGIHGATFSSAELTDASDITSGGAVQIGNAITEKMVMDVLLQARDRNLYSAVTDCGAGGFSSAVGEMGEELGAEVWLDKAPLKYSGLSYTEIWISEAQERMVFAVPEKNWQEFHDLCEAESVEATVIGQFKPTGQLVLKYQDQTVANLSMEFLHDGRPPIIREAVYSPAAQAPIQANLDDSNAESHKNSLLSILGSLNVASKHWIIRQYDYEVQGGSVIKPFVGVQNDGPSDAAVVRPVLTSNRGLVVSCGMNPHFGDIDTYHMAASAIDEAIRNCVAVGADPDRIAILDNFCWGHTDRPETLGSLVRAALACQDVATVFKTPFISGKDSLHNEFSYSDASGNRQTISIPSTLLISAMGQIDDARNCVTMDLKKADNQIFMLGRTGNHLGGSHWSLVNSETGGAVPTLNAEYAKQLYLKLHSAIQNGLVRSCHDLSEGGLAAAISEMAFAGELGVELDIANIPTTEEIGFIPQLFSESNSRFIVEVTQEKAESFAALFGDDCSAIGVVNESANVVIRSGETILLNSDIGELKSAWQNPLDWD